MPTVLITGANRGVGLEFAKQYAAEGWRVHGACRDPGKATALKAIKGDVHLHPLEVTDEAQIDALAKSLGNEPIDILINNAGDHRAGRQLRRHRRRRLDADLARQRAGARADRRTAGRQIWSAASAS